ncbi:hypothetical protein KY386_01665 [Candidatus Parcubacteria bacterium]|nr:hypothetical protein [Candidatus Parcubacteria bacterium]
MKVLDENGAKEIDFGGIPSTGCVDVGLAVEATSAESAARRAKNFVWRLIRQNRWTGIMQILPDAIEVRRYESSD